MGLLFKLEPLIQASVMEDVVGVAGERDNLIHVFKVFEADAASLIRLHHHVPCDVLHVVEHVVASLPAGTPSRIMLSVLLLSLPVDGIDCGHLPLDVIVGYSLSGKPSHLLLLCLSLPIHAISHGVLAEGHDETNGKTGAT